MILFMSDLIHFGAVYEIWLYAGIYTGTSASTEKLPSISQWWMQHNSPHRRNGRPLK